MTTRDIVLEAMEAALVMQPLDTRGNLLLSEAHRFSRLALDALVSSEAVRETCGRCKGKGTELWQKTSSPKDGREDWPCVRCKGQGWTIPPIIAALTPQQNTLQDD